MTVDQFIAEWLNSDDFIEAHTSGSTGNPKTIKLSKEFVKESAKRTIDFFELNKESHLHLCLSPDYIAGKMMIVRAMVLNCKLTIEEPTNSPLNGKIKDPIDLLAVVPSQLLSIIDSDKITKEQLKNIIVGGSAIAPTLFDKAVNSGFNIYETYGMTETASHVALRRISPTSSDFFTALPGIKFSTDNENCLNVAFANGLNFKTTDIATLLDETTMKIRGRKDGVIISGGIKIFPEEVEKTIARFLPDNTCFYITSRQDTKWSEKLLLVIEQNDIEIKTDKLIEQIRSTNSPTLCPKEILFVKKIGKTNSGKIIRHKFS